MVGSKGQSSITRPNGWETNGFYCCAAECSRSVPFLPRRIFQRPKKTRRKLLHFRVVKGALFFFFFLSFSINKEWNFCRTPGSGFSIAATNPIHRVVFSFSSRVISSFRCYQPISLPPPRPSLLFLHTVIFSLFSFRYKYFPLIISISLPHRDSF